MSNTVKTNQLHTLKSTAMWLSSFATYNTVRDIQPEPFTCGGTPV